MEIRAETDIDVRQYVHTTDVDPIIIPLSASIIEVRNIFKEVMKGPIDKLVHLGAFYTNNVENIAPYQIYLARDKCKANPEQFDRSQLFMIDGLFGIAHALAQAWKLLNSHGLSNFKNALETMHKDSLVNSRSMKYEFIKSCQHWPSLMNLLQQITGKVIFILGDGK
jgi:ATP-dependent DNA helicase MPH1